MQEEYHSQLIERGSPTTLKARVADELYRHGTGVAEIGHRAHLMSHASPMLGGMIPYHQTLSPCWHCKHFSAWGSERRPECSLPGVLAPTEPERGCGLWVRETGADDDLDELVDPAIRWLSLLQDLRTTNQGSTVLVEATAPKTPSTP